MLRRPFWAWWLLAATYAGAADWWFSLSGNLLILPLVVGELALLRRYAGQVSHVWAPA